MMFLSIHGKINDAAEKRTHMNVARVGAATAAGAGAEAGARRGSASAWPGPKIACL